MAEPRPKLVEPLLQGLFIFIIGSIFNGDDIIPSPTTRRSFALPFPSAGTSSSHWGEGGFETNFTTSSYNKYHL
jgi:hypothetical protein